MNGIFCFRANCTLFAQSFFEFEKMQIPLSDCDITVIYLDCLATIGVCVFCAATSVAALFNFCRGKLVTVVSEREVQKYCERKQQNRKDNGNEKTNEKNDVTAPGIIDSLVNTM